MTTDVGVINLGLSKISASRIARINPAKTPLETYMALNYPRWKRYELSRRRWVFAFEENYTLTLNETLTNTCQPYKFLLPNNCLRPIREKGTEWKQRGKFLLSACPTLTIDYIRDAPEVEFDPLFEEVLACKVAYESAEYVTQSNTKKQSAGQDYQDAVSSAGQANAFVIGPEDISGDDENFSWLSARYCGG